ncbi:4'-phosphopantetheinyl transferase family protein [Microbulbifer guangxiensis]|uniref:4'-phosphopantetheinyl transferase family protein n=1 Tax=Microbulbifer guangxiensis TaxID=2904249 RepID=UPI001F01F0ED|nr:4'-phosphopantetheinyl transferase superfamily protein [Microbulbifer guangxiensis]
MDSPALLRPRAASNLPVQPATVVEDALNRPVRLFCFHLDDDSDISLTEARRYLDRDERQRARAFVSNRDGERFIRAHGCLRRILALQLNREPAALEFRLGPYGRPYLPGSGLSFNMSHSEGYAVCALSRSRSVGIDLEIHQPAFCFGPLLSMVFTETERNHLNEKSGAERRKLFYEFWTAKEALMKLTGLGLNLAPDTIELLLAGDRPCGFTRPLIDGMTLQHIDCAPFADTTLSCYLVTAPRQRNRNIVGITAGSNQAPQ